MSDGGSGSSGKRLAAFAGILGSIAAIATAAAALAGVFGSSDKRPSPGPTASTVSGPTVHEYGVAADRVCAAEKSNIEQAVPAIGQGIQTGNYQEVVTASQALYESLAKMVRGLDRIEPPSGREADAARLVSDLTDARDAIAETGTDAAARNGPAVVQAFNRYASTSTAFQTLAGSLDAVTCAHI